MSPEYAFRERLTNTVSVLDGNLRGFAQEVTGISNGTFRFSWQTSANLTGKPIEGSSLCEPVSGTFSEIRVDNYLDINLVVTTVSKETDDPYWRVLSVHNSSEPTEYFARELQILYDPDDEDSAYFTCDFVDL